MLPKKWFYLAHLEHAFEVKGAFSIQYTKYPQTRTFGFDFSRCCTGGSGGGCFKWKGGEEEWRRRRGGEGREGGRGREWITKISLSDCDGRALVWPPLPLDCEDTCDVT